MELIIKPTEACNFKCSFCSSTKLTENPKVKLKIEKISKFLDRFPDTRTIIVNGGDPLMMPPDYYWKILEEIEKRNLETTLSFTTNLWAFYKNPELWTELFKHPKVGVGTSFNYGNTRKITESQVYTESDFWNVSNLFLEKVGYRPDFISVITEENYDEALKNVYLAKEMNVECKLNYAVSSGRQNKPFLKGKIYKLYLDIIEMGLHHWEYNSKQLIKTFKQSPTTCPLRRNCDDNIRNLNPEGDYYSCGALGDDKEYSINFDEEMNSRFVHRPLMNDLELQFLKQDCLTCELFSICNGCKKTIKDMKLHNTVEEHCSAMKSNLDRIRKLPILENGLY